MILLGEYIGNYIVNLIQKYTQNRSQTIPKQRPNHFKMMPKWFKNDIKVISLFSGKWYHFKVKSDITVISLFLATSFFGPLLELTLELAPGLWKWYQSDITLWYHFQSERDIKVIFLLAQRCISALLKVIPQWYQRVI